MSGRTDEMDRLLQIVKEAVGRHPNCKNAAGKRRCRWCDMRDALRDVKQERTR